MTPWIIAKLICAILGLSSPHKVDWGTDGTGRYWDYSFVAPCDNDPGDYCDGWLEIVRTPDHVLTVSIHFEP